MRGPGHVRFVAHEVETPWRRIAACLLAGVSAVLFASCSSPAAGLVAIHVDHLIALLDVPLAVTVAGLPANTRATITASAVDCDGVHYVSQATFTSDSSGRLDLARAVPASGSYTGANAMGLIENMRPTTGSQTEFGFCIPHDGFAITLTVVVAGHDVAHLVLRRLWSSPGVSERDLRPSTDGFYGDYLSPAPGSAPHPGVIVLGGSEGGLSGHDDAAVLASHGYPALALAYFGEPGIPATEQNIPLEYFERALKWLATQPGVDPNHLVVDGASRGGEAALLLGVYYPDLVHAVIATTTSSNVLCGLDASQQCDGASWTLHGAPLPYSNDFHDPQALGHPDEVIQVEKINGPILHNCGGLDSLISSCPFGIAIENRLNAARFPFTHELLTYQDAGHSVNAGVPYRPFDFESLGGTLEANQLAVADFWPRLLTFLASLGG
jgi:dienelactone hydrolase